MRILIAPDSFKESLSAARAAEAMAEGVMAAMPEADFDLLPMADGGEGTVEAMVEAAAGGRVEVMASGPMGAPIVAEFGLLDGGATAVVEMAAAAGLGLIPQPERDPRRATTRGVGEIIAHVLEYGVERIILGLGGSGTIDGGAGMAQALGFQLLDAHGKELPPGGAALAQLDRIEPGHAHPKLAGVEFVVACDVDNPLCGPHGAARVYGPQKGAEPEDIEALDQALAHFAGIVERDLGAAIAEQPGAGAAGGMGGGALAFLKGRIEPGAVIVAEAVGLPEQLAQCQLVLTGEGRLDGQSGFGKTVVSIARMAQAAGVPVFAFAGAVAPGHETLREAGLTAAFSIAAGPGPLDEARADAAENLKRTVGNVLAACASLHA